MILLNFFVTLTSKWVYLCSIFKVRCPMAVASSRLDAPFLAASDIGGPVFSFLLAVKMVADDRVALDADDSTPMAGPVFVFTLLNRCHCSNLICLWFERPDGGAGKDCFSLHRHCTASQYST